MVKESIENRDPLVDLVAIKRNREIIEGVVQSVRTMKLPQILDDGTTRIIEEVTLVVELPGGATGYCPASSSHKKHCSTLSLFY